MIATKDQERQALAKIRKIVEGLGEGSYIATAFDGVWNLAEQNIENDFAYSCANYIDRCEQADEEQRKIRALYESQITELKNRIETYASDYGVLEHQYEGLEKEIRNERKAYMKQEAMLNSEHDKLVAAETEIVKLKAKLFDLMFSES